MAFVDEDGVIALASDLRTLSDATYPANAAVASVYSSSSSYAVGAFCLKDGSLYKCNTAIGSGGEAWNSSHWTSTSVSGELSTFSGIQFSVVKSI